MDQDTDLRFITRLTGAPWWLESEVFCKAGVCQDAGCFSIHLHRFVGLFKNDNVYHNLNRQHKWKAILCPSLCHRWTHLKGVVTVKLENILRPSNASIIHDLTALGVASRDFKETVCGRNKLEVSCNDTCMNYRLVTNH